MSNRMEKPYTYGQIARPPVILQMETPECGAACLAMILACYGRWVPLEQLRVDCGVSRDGSNANNMVKAARLYGMEAHGYRMELSDLKENATFPCVVFWENNHFIVLNGIHGNKYYVNDPAHGALRMDREEFEQGFSGVVLTFEPTEEFEPGGHKKSVMKFALSRLKGMRRIILFVCLATALGYVFDIMNPAMTKVFLSYLLPGQNSHMVTSFMVLLTVITVLAVIVEWIKAFYTLRINGKMAVVGSMKFMWHVFRLPMSFFTQRMSGDILDRQVMNEKISETFVRSLAPLILDSVMMVVYLVMMVNYHLYLSIVGVAGILIHLLMAQIISNRRMNITRVQMRDEGRLYSYSLNGVRMMETLKASGAEKGYFEKWCGYQAAVYESRSRYARSDVVLNTIPEMIRNISEDLVLVVGVWLVIRGELGTGMILAFQQILNLFLRPAISTIESGQVIREMRSQMERVLDVMDYPQDELVSKEAETTSGEEEFSKLLGDIEMRDVTFGYATMDEPLIRNFNLHIRPGSRVALVGKSGCGKSTIANLLSGLYRPWDGDILFDGKRIEEIDHRAFTGSLAVVDQDIILYEDTIANTIKMWDDTIQDFEMILAARDAMLHEDIVQREHGYQSRILEGGRDLSGGQRQRMEIARVLAQDPSIVILDEATSALDTSTEAAVVRAICERGITCIIIAHRLSTIRDCDEILVMDHGEVIERGTHEELMAGDNVYKELVTDELV